MTSRTQAATRYALEALHPDRDRERWEGFVRNAPFPDVYYRPGHVQAYETAGHGTALGLVVTAGRTRFLIPLLCRSFHAPDQPEELRDAYSPYGYGGILVVEGQRPPAREDLELMTEAVRDWAVSEGLVACVLRSHPLLRQFEWFKEMPVGPSLFTERGVTVALRLEEWNYSADYPSGLSKGRKSDMGFARKHLRVTWAEAGTMEESLIIFDDIYRRTMERLSAEEFYRFPLEHYRAHAFGLGSDFGLAIARAGDEPVAAAIYLRGPRFAHYHLSGSTELGRKYKAATLLVTEGARWARVNGCEWLHLGGGFQRDDDLLAFKQSFGGERFRYGTITVLADKEKYRALCREPQRIWPYIEDDSARDRGQPRAGLGQPVPSLGSQTEPIALVGIGAGGHARVVLEVLQIVGGFDVRGLLDAKPSMVGHEMHHVSVLGDDSLLPELVSQGVRHFFVGVGSVGDCRPRRRLFENAILAGLEPVNAIHPSAIISPTARLGRGATILARAIVNSYAILGENVLLNTAAIVEHDCILQPHVHVATGAVLASGVRVGAAVHVGAGAVIRQGITIGEEAVIGAGAVVVRDVPPRTVVTGVPARELRAVSPEA
jgi:UDP-perosamine 4-acetyltransferase